MFAKFTLFSKFLIGDLKMLNPKPSKNAISHGFYASDVVLSWENQQQFDDLLKALEDEYCPKGITEKLAVFDLASLHWKKRRLETGLRQALQMQGDPNTVAEASSDWDSVADKARATGKSQLKAAKHVCDMLFEHMQRNVRPDEAKATDAVEFEKLTTLVNELNIITEGLVTPILKTVEKQKLDQTERAYPQGIMERELKLQADIDRRIEKALKRLVMIKEYKEFYLPKAIDAKPAQIEVLPANGINDSRRTEPEG